MKKLNYKYQNFAQKRSLIHTRVFELISWSGTRTFVFSPKVTTEAKSPSSKESTSSMANFFIRVNLLSLRLLSYLIPMLPLMSTRIKILARTQ